MPRQKKALTTKKGNTEGCSPVPPHPEIHMMPRPSAPWRGTLQPDAESRPLQNVTTSVLRKSKEEIEAKLSALRKAYPEWRLRGIAEPTQADIEMARLEERLGAVNLELVKRMKAPEKPARASETEFGHSPDYRTVRYRGRDPKPTQIPPDFPAYFPNGLKARTAVILAEAARNFPHQTQTLALCKHVISEMTPLFRKAVETGTMRADLVLSDSVMGGLLHSLLVYNCDHDDERFRLGQEARKSDEWLRLAKEIADARVESKSMNATTAIGRNINALRKECGWSFDKLAGEIGIDKKLILSHVNKGARPIPRILKEYAQAFSKGLQREITVSDLEE